MAEDASFDVGKWLKTRSRATEPVAVTQPKQVAVWTKTSARDGGAFLHGDSSGAAARALLPAAARCRRSRCLQQRLYVAADAAVHRSQPQRRAVVPKAQAAAPRTARQHKLKSPRRPQAS